MRWAPIAALGAGNTVILVDVDYLVTHPLGHGPQLALLVGRGLLDRGDAKVKNGALHMM
jgi:hypothetical protein